MIHVHMSSGKLNCFDKGRNMGNWNTTIRQGGLTGLALAACHYQRRIWPVHLMRPEENSVFANLICRYVQSASKLHTTANFECLCWVVTPSHYPAIYIGHPVFCNRLHRHTHIHTHWHTDTHSLSLSHLSSISQYIVCYLPFYLSDLCWSCLMLLNRFSSCLNLSAIQTSSACQPILYCVSTGTSHFVGAWRGSRKNMNVRKYSDIFWYYPAHSCGPLEALKIETRKNNNPLCRGLEGDPSICRGMTWKKTVLSQMFVMLLNYLEQFWAICTIPVNACEERKNNTPTHIVGVLEKDLSFCRGVIAWLYSI